MMADKNDDRAWVTPRRASALAIGAAAAMLTTGTVAVLAGGVAQAASRGGGHGSVAHASGGTSLAWSRGHSSPHRYRHGSVLRRGSSASHNPGRAATASTANDLSYGGAIDNVGVTTGTPRLYLVFYGSQWGTQGSTTVNGHTYATFSGDPSAMAPDLEAFFTGLGTGSELWSGVTTQYCEGVATGSFSCPSTATHVAYPTGGALAGVWEDTSAPSPAIASPAQLGQEAETAAGHFGNTTQASNRDTQYFIVSPTGTNPDYFNTILGQYCAWHDYTGDSTLGAINQVNGVLAFTNMPYVTDAGAGCGANFVNSGPGGTGDGVTIVGGHEYAETITDQFPAGGWTDSSGNENGDKCAWISSGQGAAADLTLSTGTFAVQSTWANDFNGGSGGCELSHPIVTNASANTVTVTSPGNQTSTTGSAIAPLTITATDSDTTQTLTFAASGLPSGLSISSAGVISGTPNAAVLNAAVTVTATDSTAAHGSTSFAWTVNSPGGNTVTVTNPGNQTSTAGKAITPLQMQATDTQANQVLTYSATGLPTGLTINASTGAVSGTPSSPGTSSASVTATDTTGANGTTSFTWTVNAAPNTVTVTNPGTQSTRVSTAVSLKISASDSAAGQTLTFSASGLPPGLKISTTGALTASISGTPNRVGTYTVTVTATDTTGARGTAKFSWTIRRH